jgi:ribulose-5-phosphate 4-epimerase/fuculose-1-phosphate aldolase
MLPDVNAKAVLPAMTPFHPMRACRTAPLAYFRPGDPALFDPIKALAGKYTFVLLANQGPLVAGKDLEGAVYAIEQPQETAKLHLFLGKLNPPHLSPFASI